MIRWEKKSGAVLLSILIVSMGFDAYGQELYTAVDGNQIIEEYLQDSIIEYQELGSLIHYNNTTIQSMTGSSERKKQEYTEIRDFLKSENGGTKVLMDHAKDEGDMESYMEYASYQYVYRAGISAYNKMIKSLDSNASNKSRISVEKQLTNAAQGLMISYQSLMLQKETISQMEGIYRKLYEDCVLQNQLGMATAGDVDSAYNNWQGMEISLESLTNAENSLYQNLCFLLGVEENGTLEIGRIPEFDVQLLENMNIEEDTKKAISNNSTIISTRDVSSGGTTSGSNKKLRTLEELEELVTISVQELYENVQQAKRSYDAAAVGFSSATITWSNAQKKHQMGMLSAGQYLQEELRYVEKKTNFESADLNLLQSYETYNWALKGIIDGI